MVDFHSHLDLHKDPRSVVAECENRNIRVLSVTTTPRAWQGTLSLAKNSKFILTALGIHPQLAADPRADIELFKELLPSTKFVGEIGIDGSRELQHTINQQTSVFRTIVNECEVLGGKILSIHSRNAAKLVIEELKQYGKRSIPILHWFSGSLAELDKAILLNCWFSVGPPMYYSAKGQQLIKKMPRDRVLTETDSPFVEVRGKQLKPWDIVDHIFQLGNLIGVDKDEVENLIENNCNELLRRGNSLGLGTPV